MTGQSVKNQLRNETFLGESIRKEAGRTLLSLYRSAALYRFSPSRPASGFATSNDLVGDTSATRLPVKMIRGAKCGRPGISDCPVLRSIGVKRSDKKIWERSLT